MKGIWTATMVTACVTASLAVVAPTPVAAAAGPKDPLGTVITDAINEGGPLFTASERALIDAKCGYKPGEWDGHNMSMNNGVFICENGRRVDDPEMRAMLKVAQPRIAARVSKAMSSPEVQAAIRQVASEAARKAIANLGEGRWR